MRCKTNGREIPALHKRDAMNTDFQKSIYKNLAGIFADAAKRERKRGEVDTGREKTREDKE
jgi:hypothetical protein